MSVVEVRSLSKRYGEVEAVRGLDLDVAAGETFGFLGPNGAGKSTTIKILCTLAKATSGTARVAGFDVATQRDDVRRHIGLVFQDTTLDSYLTAEQNLRFHAELYGIIVGKALGGATVATTQGLVVLALAPLVHVPLSPGLVTTLVAEVFLLSFTLTALGLAIVARITQVQTVMGLMQVLLLPLSFLSGALYPLSGPPAWLGVLVRLNPLTYAVHPVRTAVFDHLAVSPAVRARLDPPITWGGWVVPTWLQLVLVASIGLGLMTLAVRQFQEVE